MNQKGGISPIFIIGVLIVLVLAGVIFIRQTKNSPKINYNQILSLKNKPAASPSATSDPSANWLSYINTSYQYTFKYPQHNFVYQTNSKNPSPADITISNYQSADFINGAVKANDSKVFLMTITESEKAATINDAWQQYYPHSPAPKVFSQQLQNTPSFITPEGAIVFVHNQKEYTATLKSGSGMPLFYKIISTLRFLN